MTNTNPRDLIQRLTEKLDHLHCQYNVPNQSALISEAHAYLAQPEPEEEWYSRFGDWLEREMPEGTVIGDPLWWASKIADYLARWGRPAAEPVPVNDLVDLAYELRKAAEYLQGGCGWAKALDAIERAATLIESNALWLIAPIPVSKRLPGPEDCNAEGQCWLLYRSASVNRTIT